LTDQFNGLDAVVEPPSRPCRERTHDLVHEDRVGPSDRHVAEVAAQPVITAAVLFHRPNIEG
jgi:hypothetical protein